MLGRVSIKAPAWEDAAVPQLLVDLVEANFMTEPEYLKIRSDLALHVSPEKLHAWDDWYAKEPPLVTKSPAENIGQMQEKLYIPQTWSKHETPVTRGSTVGKISVSSLCYTIPEDLVPSAWRLEKLDSFASGIDDEKKVFVILVILEFVSVIPCISILT